MCLNAPRGAQAARRSCPARNLPLRPPALSECTLRPRDVGSRENTYKVWSEGTTFGAARNLGMFGDVLGRAQNDATTSQETLGLLQPDEATIRNANQGPCDYGCFLLLLVKFPSFAV